MKRLAIPVLLWYLGFCSQANGQGIITTVAGSNWVFPANVTVALNAPLGQVSGVTVDSHGNVYLADLGNARIFAVSPTGGIRIVAGNGTPGFSGDGGPATAASLSSPYGMAVDALGNLFIADWGNARIRKVTPSGVITTVAGGGTADPGNGGPATAAQLYFPAGIAVDASGNVFFADYSAQVIRKVSAGGIITTVAGNGTNGFSGDGGPATAAQLYNPEGIAVDAAGDLFIADAYNNRIRKVSAGGIITTVAGNGTPAFAGDGGLATYASLCSPQAVAVDTSGNLYVADYGNDRVRRVAANGLIATLAGSGGGGFSGDGGPAIVASLDEPEGVGVDAAGNVFIADAYNNRVRKVTVNGVITTVAGNGNFNFSGDGGPALLASLNQPYGVAVDASGDLFLADHFNNRVRKLSANGVITTVAGNGAGISSGDGGEAVLASLDQPYGLAVDASGNLFIADSGSGRIRKISAAGIVSTVAGGGGANPGDGGPATAAQLLLPAGIAVDAFGDLFIADTGNNRVRKVSATGVISTVAGNGTKGFSGDGGPATSASLDQPTGVAVDASGNLLVADGGNDRIRKVSATGVITTVAGGGAGAPGDGGPATAASLDQPGGIAVDASGDLFIADTSDNRIREVSVHGIITTVAGGGTGSPGDGGPAISASLNNPEGIAVDASGNLFIADTGNNRIREVSAPASALTVLPASLSFSLFAAGLSSQQISLSGQSAGPAWSASASASWIALSPSSGTVPGKITVAANAGSLPAGTYSATIAIVNSHASPPQEQTVSVSLTVAAALSVAPTAIGFNAVPGGAAQSQSLQIGGVPGGFWRATAAALTGAGWLSVSPGVGQVPGALTVAVNPSGLAAGVYQGNITVQAPGGAITATVTLTVASSQGGTITTVAGNGYQGSSGDGGDATSAELLAPQGIAVDSAGNSFLADTGNNLIRKVSAGGIITTVAGNRTQGFSGDGGPATSAKLFAPEGIAVDASGNLFIADTNNNLIRKVSAGGVITTVAGVQLPIFSGDGGPAISAGLAYPSDVAVDSAGNLFIADCYNNRIRKVSANGIITTVAGNATQGFSGDGGPAASASLNLPNGIAVDASGNLYIADGGNNRIRKVSASGIISTVAGNGTGGFTGDGGPASSASLSGPAGVAVDASGNLFIADAFNNRVRKVSASGIIVTVAGNGTEGFSGDGGPAAAAELSDPGGVAVDASGNLHIADNGNQRIREVSPAGPLPSITPGGIVPVDSTLAAIQPGEWVSIFGANLAASTATWNGDFPQSLGGTSVTIDGKAAYLSFVSPNQINLQAPDDTAAGPVPVVVTTANGTATSTVMLAQFGPSFLLLDSKHVAGVILRPDGSGAYGGGAYDIIGPAGNSLGYATVAAKAGDAIEVFAIGLGPTTSAVPAGQAYSGAAETANPVNLLIGNASVTPAFVGLSGAGLYQINLTVPAGLGTGDVSLAAAVGGAQTPAGVVISLE